MKKIYEIELDSDLGKLWLDENFKPIEYIHANDSHYVNAFYKKLAKKGAYETIELNATDLLTIQEYDEMCDSDPDHAEAFAKFLVPKLKNINEI